MNTVADVGHIIQLPLFIATYQGMTVYVGDGFNWGKAVAAYFFKITASADPKVHINDENLILARDLIQHSNMDDVGKQRWLRAISNYAIKAGKPEKDVLNIIGEIWGGIFGIPLFKIAWFLIAVIGGIALLAFVVT